MAKKVFIDGGARVGETLETFLVTREDLNGCDAYLFECNSDHRTVLESLQASYPQYTLHVKEEALWTSNESLNFYMSKDRWGDLGCTLDPTKQEALDLHNPRKVTAIRLSDFINSLDSDSYIIVKLDIEGAEYEVVQDLIQTGAIECIKELYVEWHDHFYPGKNFTKVRQELNQYSGKLTIGTWNY